MNSFNPNHPTRFQKVTQDFLTAAIKAGKTKLVVEFQQNTGGLILPAYDFFRQLFPNTVQDGYSRFKENDAFPFKAENIVMMYDGACASTCTIASEFLRHQANVKSVAFGGLPVKGPIEGVGGIKGSQFVTWRNISFATNFSLPYAKTDKHKAALTRYLELPLDRTTLAIVNVRDEILEDNIEDGVPAQYIREDADCRLYWTLPMIEDVTQVWKATAKAAFNGGKCAHGSIP
ncbi:pyridine nucleotide-disulfide oxidoreductase [Colletotrichum tofieldiae]|uniref:Pyridine nucleotide-disulfide oxidoreductase n=1 Tax=Colletotrichum tofieldiae TaxID=708197 RepID=A0A166XQQ2_9PEZI|nr:pyridine nucleotide-disulfide oxidoreductase [Colletotrichum tofieldiae]